MRVVRGLLGATGGRVAAVLREGACEVRADRECQRAAGEEAVLSDSYGHCRDDGGWTLWDTDIWYVPNALPQPNYYRERLLDNKYEWIMVFTKDGATDYTFHKPRVPQKYITADPRAHKKNSGGSVSWQHTQNPRLSSAKREEDELSRRGLSGGVGRVFSGVLQRPRRRRVGSLSRFGNDAQGGARHEPSWHWV